MTKNTLKTKENELDQRISARITYRHKAWIKEQIKLGRLKDQQYNVSDVLRLTIDKVINNGGLFDTYDVQMKELKEMIDELDQVTVREKENAKTEGKELIYKLSRNEFNFDVRSELNRLWKCCEKLRELQELKLFNELMDSIRKHRNKGKYIPLTKFQTNDLVDEKVG